jgi:hypothetical protein
MDNLFVQHAGKVAAKANNKFQGTISLLQKKTLVTMSSAAPTPL